MRSLKFRALSALLGACYCLTFGIPVYADDTEIFGSGTAAAAGTKPNVVFIIDTSGSMNTDVTTTNNPYDPNTTYTGACDASTVYWRQNTGAPPDCATTTQKFPLTQLKCKAAKDGFAREGQYIAVKAAMFTPTVQTVDRRGRIVTTTVNKWMNLAAGVSNQPVECQADAGIDGNGVDTSKLWAQNGNASNLWTSNAANAITWAAADNADRTYVLFSGNYLNWYYDPSNTTTKTRLQVVQEAATTLANSLDNINLGLMRYDNHGGFGETAAQGGMVTYPVSDIVTDRSNVISTLSSYTADGFTPLSETMYEAGQYYAGRSVDFGLNSRINPSTALPSVAGSRLATDTSKYKSPIQYSCQKNYIVYLTDGLPTEDNEADSKITALPNFASLVGSTTCDDSGPGRCLDDMAEYLFKADLNTGLPGQQNVITYTIGFGPEVSGSTFLNKVASRGGGQAYTADDTKTLATALGSIFLNILKTNTTFTSPAVSVNAFNRTQTLNDLYVSVFRPSDSYHWPGNVKKYTVQNGVIVDANGQPAIDRGFFKDTAQSIWSASVDGQDVTRGGAASHLPLPTSRNLYTFLGNTTLTNPSNAVTTSNASLTDALFGLGAPGQPLLADVIDWMRGTDVMDINNNGNFVEPRMQMGDPVHAKPAVVIYGGTAASPDAVVYAATNDGYLHAFNATDGTELWAFVPRELLPNQAALMDNQPTPDKHYGLDGDVRVFKIDRNGNGIIEPANGDRVLLYFGMRRGGSNYYALDVTTRTSPQFLFMLTPGAGGIGTSQLPGLGETWSTPTVAKVNVGGGATQNADKFVLIFGGGYEDSQDNEVYNTDVSGNRIYMVDAFSGNLLWFAGGTASGTIGSPSLALTKMNNSIPADILVLDINSDGYADRMYTADTGGRIWRFDVNNGQSASGLVTGGVLASLGVADLSPLPATSTNARRFYVSPDAAILSERGSSPFIALAIGSGYRGHPLNTNIRDRFYMIKDFTPFAALTQSQYNTLTVTTDTGSTPATDVQDVTTDLAATVTSTSRGWKIEMRDGTSSWLGEKVLSQANIFNNRVFFTSYIPQTSAPTDPCTPGLGTNRAYAVSLFNGSPVLNLDGQTSVNREDRYQTLQQTSIAPEIVFLFPDNGGGLTSQRPLLCLSGVEVLAGVCVNAGAPVRTFWQESGMN